MPSACSSSRTSSTSDQLCSGTARASRLDAALRFHLEGAGLDKTVLIEAVVGEQPRRRFDPFSDFDSQRNASVKLPAPLLILQVMASLSAIRKQIQRLEAEAERIAKQEMSGAIAKIKSLMSDFGITLEQLGAASARVGAKRASKKASPKRTGAGVARYADPKSGKTWTGFGRAPAWIAGAKDRDAFLLGALAAEPGTTAPVKRAKKAVVAPAAPSAAVKKVAKAVKALKKAPKKVAVASKKSPAAKKSTARKKVAPAAPATPSAAKKSASKKAPAKKIGRKSAASKVPANSAASKAPTGEGAAASAAAQ